MPTRTVEVSELDEATRTYKIKAVKTPTVKVNILNRSKRPGGHVFNDVITKGVYFLPGEIKTLEIAEYTARELREREKTKVGAWQITTDAPTPPIDGREPVHTTSGEDPQWEVPRDRPPETFAGLPAAEAASPSKTPPLYADGIVEDAKAESDGDEVEVVEPPKPQSRVKRVERVKRVNRK